MEMSVHEKYMARAIEIAKTAIGHTSPNPLVGCVVVKEGKIISEACHERYGQFHAERNALTRCKEDTTGATLYVTLEPCCHFGKTPPCTQIIIEKKIKKVYVGSIDPNPLMAGKGIDILRENGIEVETGILKNECDSINQIFFHYISTKTPYVALKYAMTLDGKICSAMGDSKWITGEKSREYVHFLRKKYSGIMVGIGTVLADNPMLNCRIEGGVNPVRIICDSHLKIPMDCDIVKTAKDIRTIIAYCDGNPDKENSLKSASVELIKTDRHEGHVDLRQLLKELGSMKIDSVLVEGGATLNGSFVSEGLAKKVYAFIAPKIIGGKNAKSPVEGAGISFMKDSMKLDNISVTRFDDDIMIEGNVI